MYAISGLLYDHLLGWVPPTTTASRKRRNYSHTHLCAKYLSLQMNLQNDSYSFLQNDTYNLEGESKFPVEGKYRAVSIEKFRTERDDCVTIATLEPLLRAVPTNISFGGGVKKIFGPLNNLINPFVNRRLCS